jgi:hypothetical protein
VNPSSSDQKGFLDHAMKSFLLCNELGERQHAFSGGRAETGSHETQKDVVFFAPEDVALRDS